MFFFFFFFFFFFVCVCVCVCVFHELRNEFHFSGVHGAMNRSGSRAK